MFPRRYFAGTYFAPRFFPQSQGSLPAIPTTEFILRMRARQHVLAMRQREHVLTMKPRA